MVGFISTSDSTKSLITPLTTVDFEKTIDRATTAFVSFPDFTHNVEVQVTFNVDTLASLTVIEVPILYNPCLKNIITTPTAIADQEYYIDYPAKSFSFATTFGLFQSCTGTTFSYSATGTTSFLTMDETNK